MAHAFELDNVRQPGRAFIREQRHFFPPLRWRKRRKPMVNRCSPHSSPRCEVMSRIGVAAGNSLEQRGFHAPGLTGTFGAAVAAGQTLGLNDTKMVNALGIAGSYSGGLIRIFPLPGRRDDQAAPSRQSRRKEA